MHFGLKTFMALLVGLLYVKGYDGILVSGSKLFDIYYAYFLAKFRLLKFYVLFRQLSLSFLILL